MTEPGLKATGRHEKRRKYGYHHYKKQKPVSIPGRSFFRNQKGDKQ